MKTATTAFVAASPVKAAAALVLFYWLTCLSEQSVQALNVSQPQEAVAAAPNPEWAEYMQHEEWLANAPNTQEPER